MERLALYYKQYAEIWNIKKTPTFNHALGALAMNAERVLDRAFCNLTYIAEGAIRLEQKKKSEVSFIENECNKAIARYEEEYGEIYYYGDFYHPVIDALDFGQDKKTLSEMHYFLAAKAIYDYVSEFDNRTFEENFYKFQDVANMITSAIYLHTSEIWAEWGGDRKLIENARKAALAKQSPYEKAGTIAEVNKLLAERIELLGERGGKATLNKMILDLIVNGDIPAPDTPTQKTIDSWIDKFKNLPQSAC